LNVREWGRDSTRARLIDEFHLVAFDLRGHGMSEAPPDAGSYAGDVWALDVAAVIETLALERPILVGWSYGGYVICD
jgi:pimeloyl-ACP methyl ester carboxylesterase